ncbi:hypothetical protein TNCV_4459001 [Trichonephila clavipes]|nr:hypothetical protein TNCV_4459001 [Trichonephila clavipes]
MSERVFINIVLQNNTRIICDGPRYFELCLIDENDTQASIRLSKLAHHDNGSTLSRNRFNMHQPFHMTCLQLH